MAADTKRPERYDTGHCEVELCTHAHGEADLQRALIMCHKNPGHEEFIPVYKFQKEHLPVGFQDSCLMDLIQVLSHLTVRVSVACTSESRPQTCPHNGTPYPFFMQRDTSMTRTGSGWVWNVERFSQMFDGKTCPCEICRLSDEPETKWAEIVIGSAAHVVFDDKEGKHTTCHLFYDKGSTPEVCPGVVTLRGMSRVHTNIKEDKCKMIYVTHDMELADRLENLTKRFVDLQKILSQMYNSNLDSIQMDRKREVSKSINPSPAKSLQTQRPESKPAAYFVDQTRNINSDRLHSRSLTHGRLPSQNTSPERSLDCSTGERSRSRFVTRKGPNSKISTNDVSQTISCLAGLSELRQNANNRSPLRNITTNIITQRSKDTAHNQKASDIQLPNIIVSSHDSARHRSQKRNAPPVTSYTSGALSENGHDSQSRSINVLPDQSMPQNMLSQSNARKMKLEKSPTRHPVLIRLKERNVKFERNETTHAPRLVSRTRNSTNNQSDPSTVPDEKTEPMKAKDSQLVSLTTRSSQSYSGNTKASQSDSNNFRVSQTHSTNNRAKVLESRNTISDKEETVREQQPRKYIPHRSHPRHVGPHEPQLILSRRTQSMDGRLDTAANPALTIIVSHPHGCNKQITIGYYTERLEVKDSRNLTRYVYTTPTCPGSSGAPVYVLGRWRGWWPCDHPHSGNSDNNKDLNFSGVGLH